VKRYVLYLLDAAGFVGHGRFVPGYVKRYDPNLHDGRGDVVVTSDPREAIQFADAKHAMAFYRQVSSTRPVRPDGAPNRPLTAFTVTIEAVEV
jgi:hypothetical protein